MALTKVTGQVINGSTGLVVGVTTVGGGLSATDGFFSGIVTAVGDASFSGNVSVGGTLTYEDVTNIDAVGLVTARNGIVVGSGITLSKDGDGFFTGVVTATSYAGDGSGLTGIAATDNVRTGILDVAGVGTFRNDVNIPDKIIHLGDTDTAIRFPAADTVSVETGGSERVRIDSSGRMGIGDDSPDRELVVKRASSNSTIKIESANTHTSQLMFADSDGEQVGRVAVFHGSGQVTSNSLTLDTAGTARVRIEPAGNVNVSQNLNVAGVCTATSFSGIGAITMFDTWGTSGGSNYSNENDITNNWVRRTGTHGGNIGNAMTQSSGVFTFPQTGLYYLSMQFGGYAYAGTQNYFGVRLYLSTNGGSSYSNVSSYYTSSQNTQYSRVVGQEVLDVTSTSDFRVKFNVECSNDISIQGGQGRTSVFFIRYGDT